MSDQIQRLLKMYAEGISGIYDKDLKSILLYGPYARGDFREDSDMDIMILVDLSEEEIQKTRRKVSDYTYDFNEEHGVDIMPLVKNEKHFNQWLRAYPFYNNIKREGIEIYAS